MLEVVETCCVNAWAITLWIYLLAWSPAWSPAAPCMAMISLLADSTGFLFLSMWKQVGWCRPHVLQVCHLIQSLVMWPFLKPSKHRWFSWTKAFFTSIVFAAKVGHLTTPCVSSLQTKQGGFEFSGVPKVEFFIWALLLSVLSLFGSLSCVCLMFIRRGEAMGLQAPDLHFQRLTRTHPYLALFSPSLSLVGHWKPHLCSLVVYWQSHKS